MRDDKERVHYFATPQQIADWESSADFWTTQLREATAVQTNHEVAFQRFMAKVLHG